MLWVQKPHVVLKARSKAPLASDVTFAGRVSLVPASIGALTDSAGAPARLEATSVYWTAAAPMATHMPMKAALATRSVYLLAMRCCSCTYPPGWIDASSRTERIVDSP